MLTLGIKMYQEIFNFYFHKIQPEIVKSCFDFISFYSNDVTYQVKQLISLKEPIRKTKIQTIQELTLNILSGAKILMV